MEAGLSLVDKENASLVQRILHIKVMADYGCHPLWWDQEQDRVGDIDPDDLGLSRDLSERLEDWAARFDATLNQTYPPDSDFETPEARLRFIQDGEALSYSVARELGPAFAVRYWPPAD